MKFITMNPDTLERIRNAKLFRNFAALAMAGVTLVTLSSCSEASKKNTPNESSVSSVIVTETNNEHIEDEKPINNAQLPSFYNCFNIFEKAEYLGLDSEKFKDVIYFKLETKKSNFLAKLLLGKPSIEDIKFVLNEIETNLKNSEQLYELGRDESAEILAFDESSFLFKYKNKENYQYVLFQLNGEKGYGVVFQQIELKSYSNSNCLIFYSDNGTKIITYNKLTGDLVVLENTVYLAHDNDIISFATCGDKESIYHYDAMNKLSENEPVNNLTIQENYVSYDKDNIFNAYDLLNGQKYTKDLGKENFWIELSGGSIVYVHKDGHQERYRSFYNLEEGDFNKDYCILSHLITYPDENGNYRSYLSSLYFNKNLDRTYEVPYFDKMLDNNIGKGYIKYLQSDGSDGFVDLTTGKIYYIKDIILSNEYTIYQTYGASEDAHYYSIFKDEQGKTVLEVSALHGYVQKYFDEEKIAIQCNYTGNRADGKTVYYAPKILDLSDFNNPKEILISSSKYFDLVETPISTIFKVSWQDGTSSLIDIKGNELTDKVNEITFDTYQENGQAIYIANLGYEFEFRNHIYFDENGNIIDETKDYTFIESEDPVIEWKITLFKINDNNQVIVGQVVPKNEYIGNVSYIVNYMVKKHSLDAIKIYDKFDSSDTDALEADNIDYYAPLDESHLLKIDFPYKEEPIKTIVPIDSLYRANSKIKKR